MAQTSKNSNNPEQEKHAKFPVLTVLKNNAVLKNIFLVHDGNSEDQTVLIGRHPDCNIVLMHPSVSRFHLRIRSNPSSHTLSLTLSMRIWNIVWNERFRRLKTWFLFVVMKRARAILKIRDWELSMELKHRVFLHSLVVKIYTVTIKLVFYHPHMYNHPLMQNQLMNLITLRKLKLVRKWRWLESLTCFAH
ncbi:hypothetical protein V8G54_028487 [Vigna mungo]|uniref:FHA domain-containing protein n=1 Tax=Vigna mungo TaxID=3915 RepID=A0AAQ3MSN7_VIGMU